MSRHDKTLEALFASPTLANIRWDDAVSLVAYYGADIKSSGGSAHKSTMPNGASAVIHKPHLGNQLSRGRVVVFRELLMRAGLEPDRDENGGENVDANI